MIKVGLIIIFLVSAIYAKNSLSYVDSLRVEAKPQPYYDFGVQGKEYNITEPDMYQVILEGVSEFQTEENIQKIRARIKEIVSERAIFKTDKSSCSVNKISKWEKDYFTYKSDVVNPMGRVISKKGEKALTPPLKMERFLCFIDGKDPKTIKDQVEFFQNKTSGQCIYAASNIDVRKLWKSFPGLDFYPSSEELLTRFKVPCAPSIVRMRGSETQRETFSIKQFKR